MEIGRCELGSTPRGVIAGENGLLKLVFRRADGALVGVHVIGALASELACPGQALIHGGATIEDVIRMGYNTPTYTYGYKLAGIDALRRLEPRCYGPCGSPPAQTGRDRHRVRPDLRAGDPTTRSRSFPERRRGADSNRRPTA